MTTMDKWVMGFAGVVVAVALLMCWGTVAKQYTVDNSERLFTVHTEGFVKPISKLNHHAR